MIVGVEFARSDDRSVVIVVAPSGGRPDFARIALASPYRSVIGPRGDLPVGDRPGVGTLAAASFYYRGFAGVALGSLVAHWLAYWIVFRGGWTVHVDAPDRDPIRDRAAADARARQIGDDVAARGEAAIYNL